MAIIDCLFMLLTAYLEMFHGSILPNCWLPGCNSHADVSSGARCLYFGHVRAVPTSHILAGFSMRGSRVGDRVSSGSP